MIKLYITLRLGNLAIQNQHFETAKEIYLHLCQLSPSAQTWLGVGIACMKLKNYDEAEQALAEANLLNPCDASVWGYIALLCLIMNKDKEAEVALREAVKQNLVNAQLFR